VIANDWLRAQVQSTAARSVVVRHDSAPLPEAPPVRRGRAKWWLAAAVVIAAGGLTWAVWPQQSSVPHARQYLNVSACLLTDPSGIVAGSQGAAAWAAMETASLATRVMVSYLPDTGTSDVAPMLNTLVERQCGVIIATDSASNQVIEVAKANPHEHFLLIAGAGAPVAAAPANAVVVSPSAASGRIDQAIHALATQT
jgi:basic membrane lipoprotein Med (substrate-binding protein (PBP1-ABC) superfamily)